MSMDGLLNKQFLADIGVKLDEQTHQALSDHYEQTLNERVIDEITTELDEAQLNELSRLTADDPSELSAWLATNVSKLGEIIENEVDILMGEIAENSDQIV